MAISEYRKQQNRKLSDQFEEKFSPRLPDFIKAFLNSKHNITQSTKNSYAQDLIVFLEYLLIYDEQFYGLTTADITPATIAGYTAEDFDNYASYLRSDKNGSGKENSTVTLSHKITVLKNLYQYLSDEGIIQKNPMARYENFVPKKSKSIVRLTSEEVNALVDNTSTAGYMNISERQRKFHEKSCQRDTAVIKLFLGTGMRISELVGINVLDINFKENNIHITRKGEHEDIVFFPADVAVALQAYKDGERAITARKYGLKGVSGEAFFLSSRGTRFSKESIERIVKIYSSAVTGKHVTAHKLRATYGTNLYNATHDLLLTRDALGHSSPETTAKFYVDSKEQNMARAGEAAENMYKE